MVSKVMKVEASADEKQVYQFLSLGGGEGTKEVPSANPLLTKLDCCVQTLTILRAMFLGSNHGW